MKTLTNPFSSSVYSYLTARGFTVSTKNGVVSLNLQKGNLSFFVVRPNSSPRRYAVCAKSETLVDAQWYPTLAGLKKFLRKYDL